MKDAGADQVADAGVDKITLTENENNSAQVTDIQQNKVDFMIEGDRHCNQVQEVKTRYGDRFRLEESINTYYFWMNTQQPAVQRRAGCVRPSIMPSTPEALNRIFGGRLHPTQQILPPGMPGYEEFQAVSGS